jgi:membrane protease YdiL (CAAX protease family)
MRIFGAAILAFLVVGFAGGAWMFLLLENLRTSPAYPWSVAVMALILWTLWQYLGGRWGPRASSQYRARSLRANRLPAATFALALVAGLSSIIALAGFWSVLSRLTVIAPHLLPNFSNYPVLTVGLVLVMASLVNSIAEEAGFRGYLQGALELRMSGPAATAVTALVMMPAHALTQGFVWQVVLFYLLVDVVLGTMVYLTDSILPGLVVHALTQLISRCGKAVPHSSFLECSRFSHLRTSLRTASAEAGTRSRIVARRVEAFWCRCERKTARVTCRHLPLRAESGARNAQGPSEAGRAMHAGLVRVEE